MSKRPRYSIAFDPADAEWLEREAAKNSLSVSSFVRTIMKRRREAEEDWLDRHRPKAAKP